MQFSTKIDGFEQKDLQGFENSYNSYEQYPLEKFFIFTIYQNYTLALKISSSVNDRRCLWGKLLSLMIRYRLNVTTCIMYGPWSVSKLDYFEQSCLPVVKDMPTCIYGNLWCLKA